MSLRVNVLGELKHESIECDIHTCPSSQVNRAQSRKLTVGMGRHRWRDFTVGIICLTRNCKCRAVDCDEAIISLTLLIFCSWDGQDGGHSLLCEMHSTVGGGVETVLFKVEGAQLSVGVQFERPIHCSHS